MGICPNCGSFVDEGEPYCPDCSYIFGSDSGDDYCDENDYITIDGRDYDKDRLIEALEDRGYDLRDLEYDLIDEDELEEILYDL